ncbi:MAG TPA: hypothetical protein VM264_08695 [Acidimicrobiales bacterium]|nr:hypothetical protein [Acidimicrobiales bacterium]
MQAAYAVLAERGTLRDDLELVLSFDEFSPVVELDRHYGLEARYTGSPDQAGLE